MSAAEDAAILEDRFRTALEDSDYDDLFVLFENDGTKAAPPANAPWMRFSVNATAIIRAGYTDALSRHEGLGRVEVQVFVPRGAGTGTRDTIADWAGEVFRGWRSDDGAVRCGTPDTMTGAAGEKDQYSMRRVSVPYRSQHYLPD